MRPLSAPTLLLGGLLLLTAAPVLAADPSPAPSAGPGVPLEDTTWSLTNLWLSGAYGAVPPGVEATMRIADGRAGGNGGCNDWSADVTIDGSSITFGQVVSTLKLCEGAGGTIETFFFADLGAVSTWTIDGSTLTLAAKDGQAAMAFQALPVPSLVGSWLATGYLDPSQGFVTVDDGSVTLTFEAASVHGNAGCNGFGGDWTLTDGVLAVGPLSSTRMACEPASVMARESAVMADLEASVALRPQVGGGVTLLDTTGVVRLTLAPVAVQASGAPGSSPEGSPLP